MISTRAFHWNLGPIVRFLNITLLIRDIHFPFLFIFLVRDITFVFPSLFVIALQKLGSVKIHGFQLHENSIRVQRPDLLCDKGVAVETFLRI